MEISQVLKDKRQEYNLNQDALAEQLFVSKKTISNWETGKTTPDLTSVIRLAELFDLSLDNLLLEGKDVAENIIRREKTGERLEKVTKFWTASYIINLLFFLILTIGRIFKLEIFVMGSGVSVLIIIAVVVNIYLLLSLTKEKERLKKDLKQ